MKPGLLNDTFYIQFNENWFDEGSILQTNYTTHKVVVLETPKRIWYKILWQWLSFGLYRCPYQYKVKILKDEHASNSDEHIRCTGKQSNNEPDSIL